jgi:integrase
MRCGELLALRWRDIGPESGTISVCRSAGVVRSKGDGVVVKQDHGPFWRPK